MSDDPSTNDDQLTVSAEAGGRVQRSAAVARDANGNVVARVSFTSRSSETLVAVAAMLPPGEGIHGFHVHANDNPANGDGCIADPTQPPNTFFVSADGHFNPGGSIHGDHAGDMPALFVGANGKGAMTFITDRFSASQLVGRAIIIHQLADNYANVPVGTAANQYTANSPDAVTLTQNTGNAGNRIACGVIVQQ